jgi:hypothetical protein
MVEALSIIGSHRRRLSEAQINKYLLTMLRKICKEADRKSEGQVSNRTKSVTVAWTANGQDLKLTVGESVRGVVDNVIVIANRVTGITTRYESV